MRATRQAVALAATALAVLLLLSACAIPARVQNMVPEAGATAAAPTQALAHGIGIVMVDGGRPTLPFLHSEVGNDAFAAAIKSALAENDLWAADAGDARYALHASLVRDDVSLRGLSKSVRSVIRYRLQDLASRRIVLDEKIESRHTVTFDDTPIASLRERSANEGAIRKSLAALIARLRAVSTS